MKPVIWDTFIFANEFDCLDMRLHELDGLVYKHLLIEADGTFQGDPKPYRFKERVQDYADWPLLSAQIKLTGGRNPWHRETAQRNATVEALKQSGAQPSDWIMLSDTDEIPEATVLERLMRAADGRVDPRLPNFQISFEQTLCFYYVNNECTSEKWHGTQIVRFADLLKRGAQGARDKRNAVPVVVGGWHFCNLGDAEFLREKIQSFSHVELNRPEITDLDFLDDMIRNRQVIEPPTDHQMTFRLNDEIPPAWVQDQRARHPEWFALELAAT